MYEIGQEEIDAVSKVIQKQQFFRYRGGENGEVDAFEKRMREMLGVNHFLGVTSGTAALICGLAGLELGPGDEVIIPGYSFMAAGLAVLNVGAIPVIAEINETMGIDPADIELKVTSRTKAILPVHMCGLPCDMDGVMAVARRHNLKVIEDACQAVGGSFKGRRLSAIGHVGAFSFNQFKNICCGEGGGLATSDRSVFERALIYHDGGATFRSHAGELQIPLFAGDNYRMDEIQGAILNVQLSRLDSILERLRRRKKLIIESLQNCAALFLTPSNDPMGDCGSNFFVQFDSASMRTAVTTKLREINPEYVMSSPVDPGRYVYSDWLPMLEQRGSYIPANNAYERLENRDCRKILRKDSCPRTLDILDRTGGIELHTKVDLDFYEGFAAELRKVAESHRSNGAGISASPVADRNVRPTAPGHPLPEPHGLQGGTAVDAAALARTRAFDEVRNGCHHAAIAALKALTQAHPDFALAFNDLGALYYHQNMNTEALAALQIATTLTPTDVNALRNLADVCVAMNRSDQALEVLRRIIALDESDREALQMLSELNELNQPPLILVITGVTRGLGRAMAEELIRCGHIIWGCGRSAAKIDELRQLYKAPHRFDVVDVASDEQVRQWALSVLRHGTPHFLINNAGLINRMAPLWQVPPDEFSDVLDVNVKGVANTIRHFVPAMLQRRRGVIVNFSSGWGRSASAHAAPYCATKFAVEGLTQALAQELPPGMAAVPLSPGMINTDMLRSSFGSSPSQADTYPDPSQWARKIVPFILKLGPKDNGCSLSAP